MLSYEHTSFVCFLFKRKILHEFMHINFFPSILTRGLCFAKGRKNKPYFFKKTLSQFFFIVITARTLILIEIGELHLMSP